MKLKIGEKELNIKFGYKPTLKGKIISKLMKFETAENKNDAELLEEMLLFIPELLLAGLQVHHEEYRYNYDTGEGKEEQLDKAFALIEGYLDEEDADIMELFRQLEEEMLQNSFLKKLFQQEKEKQEEKMTPEAVDKN